MPFIDSNLLLNEKKDINRLLITCADDSDVISVSFKLAKQFQKNENSVLWIDGNLGEHNLNNCPENPDLERIILGQLPLTQAIQEYENFSVLSGTSKHFLSELSDVEQYQFIQDLRKIYPNFDKIILTVNGNNPILQKKWMGEMETTYFLFNAKNLLLNRTLSWLKDNGSLVKGIIGIGKNQQEILLTYMRLKEILKNQVPELILDIKKIAP